MNTLWFWVFLEVYHRPSEICLEYAVPEWEYLPAYSANLVKAIQKGVLAIIFLNVFYDKALANEGVSLLSQRKDTICKNFVIRRYSRGPRFSEKLKGHSMLRTLHPESKILEMKLFFTNLSFVVFI